MLVVLCSECPKTLSPGRTIEDQRMWRTGTVLGILVFRLCLLLRSLRRLCNVLAFDRYKVCPLVTIMELSGVATHGGGKH